MTPSEADRRIILSRKTCALYGQMLSAGKPASEGNLDLIEQELLVLEALAEEHPEKADKIAGLVERWGVLGEALMVANGKRLH